MSEFKRGDRVICSEFNGGPGFVPPMDELVGKLGRIAYRTYSGYYEVEHEHKGIKYLYTWPVTSIKLECNDIEDD